MKGKGLLLFAVGMALILTYFKEKPVIYANNQTYQLYEVTIEGSVGGRSFTRGGTLFVRPDTTNEVGPPRFNLVDFWLVSGKPTGTAGKGAIWLATNSGFYGLVADKPLATVSAQDNVLVASFNPQEIGGYGNAFSLSAERGESAKLFIEGQVHLNMLIGGDIEGAINLSGFSPLFQDALSYTANINGHYIGERSW